MRAFRKKDFPVSDVRRFLEPGPIVLIQLGLEGQDQHHDARLAHGDGVHAVARRLLHLRGAHVEPRQRQRGVRDQYPDL